mgnify:CR=1 FL=1
MVKVILLTLVLAAGAANVAAAPACDREWSCDGVARVVAIGDVHGALAEYTAILRATGIIDAAGHWAGGDTYLVSTGDLIDRGPESSAVIALLRRLEAEAPIAGGRVLVTLGNHEAMNLTGELGYVVAADYAAAADSEDAALRDAAFRELRAHGRYAGLAAPAARAAFDQAFPQGWFARQRKFSAVGEEGRWLLARPLMVRVNGVLIPTPISMRASRSPKSGALATPAPIASISRPSWPRCGVPMHRPCTALRGRCGTAAPRCATARSRPTRRRTCSSISPATVS